MADERKIRGEATLTLSDILVMSRVGFVRGLRFVVVGGLVLFPAIWALTLPDEDWLDLRNQPLLSLRHMIRDLWWVYLGVVAAAIVGMVLRVAYVFARQPEVNRRIVYEADASGLTVRDAADFAFHMAWTSVIAVKRTPRLIRMQIGLRAWRHVVTRAVSAEDVDQLVAWARRTPTPTPQPELRRRDANS